MSWLHRKKKHFLIKLMALLGYGGMTAYCIGGCDSKPAQNESQTPPANEVSNQAKETAAAGESVQKPETENSPQLSEAEESAQKPEPKKIIFKIEYTPKNADVVSITNGNRIICYLSPCIYEFDPSIGAETLQVSAPGYKTNNQIVLTDHTDPEIKVNLEVLPHKYGILRPPPTEPERPLIKPTPPINPPQ